MNMKAISVLLGTSALLAGMAVAQSTTSGSSSSQAAAGQTQMQPANSKSTTNMSATSGTVALPENRTKLGGNDPTARISREVMHELLMNPYYSVFDNLAYKVEGSSVTLMGSVTQPRTKEDAVASVKKIEGVEKVNDQIEVLPPSPLDDQIRRAEYRAIYGSDGLSKYSLGAVPSIHIVVKNGHVQLVGVVDNPTDKNMAGLKANGVPNVFSVENNLQVAPSS